MPSLVYGRWLNLQLRSNLVEAGCSASGIELKQRFRSFPNVTGRRD